MTQPFLSAILIVKNEEKNLPRCLSSLQGVCDEICVVDTSSTDRTVEIAKSLGAEVSFFAWNGIEADARNASVRMAKGKWILMIDADEEVSPELAQEIALKLPKLDEKKKSVSVVWRNIYQDGSQSLTRTMRMARRSEDFIFEGNIHPSANYQEPSESFDGFLNHYGYIWTPEQRQKKCAHMLAHLEPLIQGEKPPLDRLSQYLIYLIIAEREEEFRQRLEQVKNLFSSQERSNEIYWKQSLSNILLHFSEKDDFESGRFFAEEILQSHSDFVAALFYLLQNAVKLRQWEEVVLLADRVLDSMQQSVGTANVVFPKIQIPAAQAWIWLAEALSKVKNISLPEDLIQSRLIPALLYAHDQLKLECPHRDFAQLLRVYSSFCKDQKPLEIALMQISKTVQEIRDRSKIPSAEHLLSSFLLFHAMKETGQTSVSLSMLEDMLNRYADHRWLAMAFRNPEQWSPRFYENALHQT